MHDCVMDDLVSAVPGHEPADDTLAFAGKAALSAIPVIGPLAAETLAYALDTRQAARQHEFNVLVAGALTEAIGRLDGTLAFEDIVDSDEFVASIARASRVASETVSCSKRKRLAAAVANSGDWSVFAKRERTLFGRLVEDFDDLHVWLLHYLSDPEAWLAKHGYPPGDGQAEDVIRLPKPTPHLTPGDENPLTTVFGVPFKTYYPVITQVVGDLERAGLTSNELRDQLRRLWPALHGTTNDKGRRFLHFLDEQSSADVEAPEL